MVNTDVLAFAYCTQCAPTKPSSHHITHRIVSDRRVAWQIGGCEQGFVRSLFRPSVRQYDRLTLQRTWAVRKQRTFFQESVYTTCMHAGQGPRSAVKKISKIFATIFPSGLLHCCSIYVASQSKIPVTRIHAALKYSSIYAYIQGCHTFNSLHNGPTTGCFFV